MAQAVFDSHPLHDYLEETYNESFYVPGAYVALDDEEGDAFGGFDLTWLPPNVLLFLENIQKALSAIQTSLPAAHNDFAERFKYDLISSTLLSTAVPATPLLSHTRQRPPSPPSPLPGELSSTQDDTFEKSEAELKFFSSAFAFLGIAAAINQQRIVAIIAFVVSYTSMRSFEAPPPPAKQYPEQMHQALQQLKEAGGAWDACINECMSVLDHEERGASQSSGSSSGSSANPSALRVALHSTLLTTRTQCDNVRPLLAALASPSELSPLSEMYAPPSPAKSNFSMLSPQLPRRPFSLSESAAYTPPRSEQSSTGDKRQTWNGSYMSLADFSSRSPPSRKRNWRRSDLSSLMEGPSSSSVPRMSRTNPASPLPPVSPLSSVQEADDESERQSNVSEIDAMELEASQDNFGTAALFLRRKRRTRGSAALGIAASRSAPSLRSPPLSSSKFTEFHPSRHPLSASALHNALDSAVASRRYACAHLLALRFDEDAEDDSYWDNVRSVMSLLTTTLEDASARLSEALSESDEQRTQMALPSPLHSPLPAFEVANGSFLSLPGSGGREQSLTPSSAGFPSSLGITVEPAIPLSPLGIQSFAPMPSGLSRFGGHVDSISGALDEARVQLREVVSTIQGLPSEQPRERSSSERIALDYLEKLRRELGLALRECERGKLALVDHFEARRRRSSAEYSLPGSESDEEDVTLVGVDQCQSSGESDGKLELSPITPDDGSPIMPSVDMVLAGAFDGDVDSISTIGIARDADDVTQHLLDNAMAQRLPPPGIEQVFESESILISPFSRERSKMTRDERIKLQKAKRESVRSRIPTPFGSTVKVNRFASTGLGPSVDVVDELKDVIWKVSEKRRKLKEAAAAASTLETIVDEGSELSLADDSMEVPLKPSMHFS